LTACERCLRRAALLRLLAPYIERALDRSQTVPALLSLSDEQLIAAVCGRNRAPADELLRAFDAAAARRDADAASLTAICRHTPGFPARLVEAPDAPALLYLRGKVEPLERLADEPAVTVVGSRRASAYGLEVADSLARELAGCGVPVVSGMALGIDSAAHEGALAAGGFTVAVLGGGADVPYPRSKRGLYEQIVDCGLVLSELPPGVNPFRWCFPARNRVMAALSSMTVVVEGTASSGSLITARFASDLGREVGAVPGQITSPLATGPNALIADGACVVRSAGDVLDALYGPGSGDARSTPSEPELDERLRSLLEAVERGHGSIDSIAAEPCEVPEALAGLTELELLGLIKRGPAGNYIRST
jgi:DNA processing protein